jgi:molybdopterin molybdotransferase
MTRIHDIAALIDNYDTESMSMAAAQAFIARLVPRVGETERVPLKSALGRVLASDIVSPINVPAHDNSAMDGYALRSGDLAADVPSRFRVAGKALAGQPFEGSVAAKTCVRIMTGAVMPPGLDTVVPQELVQLADDGTVTLPAGVVRAGDNRRLAGEDLRCGEAALRCGRLLRPADLGLMASLGFADVPVVRPLRVAFFSTGSELRSVGQALEPGCLYDSNRYTLWGMLLRLGVEPIDMGLVSDDAASLEAALRQATECADAVITSGGVSVGEADHTRAVMQKLGEVLFWKLAIRPGRPLAVGRIESGGQQAILFGLPGNPVAVMVAFYAFVRDALLAMSGAAASPLPMLRAATMTAMRKRAGRTEYQRGIVSRGAEGRWQVELTGSQGSGILRSMSLANGLIVLPHDQGHVEAGEEVDVLPFDGLV